MRHAKRHYEIDMTSGPLLKKILFFAAPLMATAMLQLLYNAADIAVVGLFATVEDQAAVGSVGALINLVVNLFIGLSVGASVALSNHYGAHRAKEANRVVHTAITVSLIVGVAVGILSYFAAPMLVKLTGTPMEVEDKALSYLSIYFLGLPAAMVYNFGAALLRAVGDTRRPMYYLMIAGVVNIALNLIAVIVFHMGAAGVALATTASQAVSAALVVTCLARSSGVLHLNLRALKIHRQQLVEIARVGIPAGLQSTVFSISNVLIQSSVNSFGAIVMAGNTVAQSLDGFVNATTSSLGQAAMSFAAQNMGAREYRRVGKVVGTCCLLVLVMPTLVGGLIYALGPLLLGWLYTTNQQVIQMAMVRLQILCFSYALCGLMDVLASSMRGMGNSLLPMLVTLAGVVGIRIVWLYTVFAWRHTLVELYLSYPVSWLGTAAVHFLCFMSLYKKLIKNQNGMPTPQSAGS